MNSVGDYFGVYFRSCEVNSWPISVGDTVSGIQPLCIYCIKKEEKYYVGTNEILRCCEWMRGSHSGSV